MIKIGVLFEGRCDIEPLKGIVNKILNDVINEHEIEYVPFPANGSICSKIDAAINAFFKINDCKFALFVTDNDSKQKRCNDVKKRVEELTRSQPHIKVIVACPEPTFEEWFIHEEDAVKKYFKLPGDQPLPNKYEHPKKQIELLIKSLGDRYLSIKNEEIYYEISQLLNLKKLRRSDSSFNDFYEELVRIVNLSS